MFTECEWCDEPFRPGDIGVWAVWDNGDHYELDPIRVHLSCAKSADDLAPVPHEVREHM